MSMLHVFVYDLGVFFNMKGPKMGWMTWVTFILVSSLRQKDLWDRCCRLFIIPLLSSPPVPSCLSSQKLSAHCDSKAVIALQTASTLSWSSGKVVLLSPEPVVCFSKKALFLSPSSFASPSSPLFPPKIPSSTLFACCWLLLKCTKSYLLGTLGVCSESPHAFV